MRILGHLLSRSECVVVACQAVIKHGTNPLHLRGSHPLAAGQQSPSCWPESVASTHTHGRNAASARGRPAGGRKARRTTCVNGFSLRVGRRMTVRSCLTAAAEKASPMLPEIRAARKAAGRGVDALQKERGAKDDPKSLLIQRSPLSDSNRRPLPYHGSALPAELRGRSGSAYRVRRAHG
jgi:hypothetical protein